MSSYSTSKTRNYSYTPVVQDNENPLVITGSSGTELGDAYVRGNLSLGTGASINTLDGGAIEKAFDFSSGSVEKVLDLAATAFSNAQQAQGSLLDILSQQSATAADSADPEAATEKRTQILLLGFGALLVVAYVMKRGK